ncbi:hypothetical protein QQX98_001384 [Neonectria punicea]|uniref:Diels-Alderase N-terminal domain-containing protein n=1 Tax=Neonectria punicea TaxID=979145 RepID=A0ABR1HPS5_9HYPO
MSSWINGSVVRPRRVWSVTHYALFNWVEYALRFAMSTIGFDGPKVDFSNGTSFDFWYFDTVSYHGQSSLTVVFQFGSPNLPVGRGLNTTSTNTVTVSGNFANGTSFAKVIEAGTAIVSTSGDGTNGKWGESGMSWSSTTDMSEYLTSFETSDDSFKGSFSLKRIAPPRHPCAPPGPGADLEILPGLGWTSAVPDGESVVSLTVNGEPLEFLGSGYHDKDWGHGRAGPYSIVWTRGVNIDGVHFYSGYASLQGREATIKCEGVEIVPHLTNKTSPGLPKPFVDRLTLKFHLDDQEEDLEAEVVPHLVQATGGNFVQYLTNVTVAIGDQSWTGFGVSDFAAFAS